MRLFGIPALQISMALFLAICADNMLHSAFWPGILLACGASFTLFAGLIAFGRALRAD